MLPAIHIPTYKIAGLIPIQPFGLLVGLAIVVGYLLGRRRAEKVGLDPDLCADGEVWIVVGGFVVAHLVSVIFYFPERILENPLALLEFWSGLSSFGGLIGAAIATYWFFTRHGAKVIAYVDAIIFGFVPAWILGRLGCTIVYDHPGIPTDFVLGMSDKTGMPAGFFGLYYDGVVRHNLGFYELLLAIALTVILYAIRNIRPFYGFHPAVMLILYAPARYVMDTLRIQDETYLGLTPGQYFSGLSLLTAAVLIYRGLKHHRTPGGLDPVTEAPGAGVQPRTAESARPAPEPGKHSKKKKRR